MTRATLMSSLTTDELAYWLALERIEPRHDPYLVAGVICQYILAGAGAKKIPELHRIFAHLPRPAPDSLAVVKAKIALQSAMHR